MFLAELTCGEKGCELILEAVGELEELELLVCEECDCCLQIVSLSAHEAGELGLRVELPRAA